MTYDEKQFEVVRTVLDEAQRHYEQATFELPARRTTKASIWLGVYALLAPAIPGYFGAVLKAQSLFFTKSHYVLLITIWAAFILSIAWLGRGIRWISKALSSKEFEWLRADQYLHEVEASENTEKRMLYYFTLILDLRQLTMRNINLAAEIDAELTSSRRLLLLAIAAGVVTYCLTFLPEYLS